MKGLSSEVIQPGLHSNKIPLTAMMRIDYGEQKSEEEVNWEAVGGL